MPEAPNILDIWLRLLAAIACGGVIGWEREAANKSAGFRTHIMVGLGAAAFTLVALQLFVDSSRPQISPGDPTRAIQGVVTGIGFLGAGAIIRGRHHVKGLTTAASIWVVGAVGTACGAGAYKIAALVTVHALVILLLVRESAKPSAVKPDKLNNGDDDDPDDDEDDQIPSLPTG